MADDFLPNYAGLANDISTRTGLDPAVVLGIIDLESAGGKRLVGNNIFGISPSRNGRQYVAQYPDVQAASEAFVGLMNSKPYASVRAAQTPEAQAQALVRSGYNTVNPRWASIVANRATTFGGQLGYQDAAPAATKAAPAAPAQQPPAPGSAEHQLVQDLNGSPTPPQTPATATAPTAAASGPAPGSAEEQLVRELKPTTTATTTAAPTEPSPGPKGPIDWTSIGPDGVVGSGTGPPATTVIPTTDEGIRNALEPAPNTTYGEVLPFAKDDKTGEIRLALPEGIRGFARGLYDLSQSPATGTISPEQTATMAMIAGLRGPEAGAKFGGINRVAPDFVPPQPGWRNPLAGTTDVPSRLPPGDPALGRNEMPNPLGPAPYPEIPAGGWRLRPEGAPDPAAPPAGPAAPDFIPPGTRPPPVPPPEPPAFVPPGTAAPEAGAPAGGPQPGMGGGGSSPGMGGPQPAGAQVTPAGAAALTPEQAAAYGSMADKQWVFSSQEPGIRDTTQYIHGETISTAQREQTANAAREQKTQRNISPAAQQEEERFLHDQSEFRKNHFQETAGNDVLQQTAMKNAAENIEAGLTKAFNAGGKVDTAPIASAAAAELRGSAGELPPLKSVMQQITDALADKTDPRDVYKVRRLINYMQSKTGKAANLGYGDADVQAALVRVKQVVDRQIEPAAPGFGAAMADYSAAQRAIEANEYLQKEEPKLYDKNARMQYSRFHNFMVRMVMQRDPNVAPNPAQSVSQAQFERLQGIHDSLKRAASAEDLARAKGSDSAPNLIDIAKEALSGLPGQIAAGVVGHAALGPFGAAAAPVVKAGIGAIVSRRGQARATAKMQNLLYPEGTSPPSPNALGPD